MIKVRIKGKSNMTTLTASFQRYIGSSNSSIKGDKYTRDINIEKIVKLELFTDNILCT